MYVMTIYITSPSHGGIHWGQAPFGELGGATIKKAKRENVIRRHCSLLTPLSYGTMRWHYTSRRRKPMCSVGSTDMVRIFDGEWEKIEAGRKKS